MDSRIYQKNQEFSLGNGTLNVNLYNGRMLYNYEATSISNGNYQISSGLVYNSHYRDLGNKVIGFGNGWKYDFEEFVFKYKTEYNLTGFNENDYVYIDSNWCIHRFVKYISCNGYDVAGDAYYDESGTGLKLVVLSGQNYKMYDEYGNTYIFDNESGKLIEFVSGVNADITKKN